jgi:hypothetical protein
LGSLIPNFIGLGNNPIHRLIPRLLVDLIQQLKIKSQHYPKRARDARQKSVVKPSAHSQALPLTAKGYSWNQNKIDLPSIGGWKFGMRFLNAVRSLLPSLMRILTA